MFGRPFIALCSFNAVAKPQNTWTNCYSLDIPKRSIVIKNRRQGKVEGQITDMRALIWKKIIIKLSEITKKYDLTTIQA